jgi:hypothetical protein
MASASRESKSVRLRSGTQLILWQTRKLLIGKNNKRGINKSLSYTTIKKIMEKNKMYLFALAIASLMGFVCARGIFMATNSKWKTISGFLIFTFISFIAIIS